MTTASNHAMVEVAEYKAKLRKLRQQLDEKTEKWSEVREELEKLQEVTDKLKSENLELCQDARAAKTYRDELDVLRERAEKVDKLEAELLRYKDKMNDIEFFKSRVEELREDNRILVETKDMLEEQLATARKRSEKILELENDIIHFKGDIERLQHEKEGDRARIKDLVDENAALALSQKNSMSESQVRQYWGFVLSFYNIGFIISPLWCCCLHCGRFFSLFTRDIISNFYCLLEVFS